MFDVVEALRKSLDQTARAQIASWLNDAPKGAAWHVISDYVFDDPNRHPTASFVILLHYDKLAHLLDQIEELAPVDIKKSRNASQGLISYLQSRAVFSFTFVLDEDDDLLRTFAPACEMIGGLEELCAYAEAMHHASGGIDPYYAQAQKRMRSFVNDLRSRGNLKLARKMYIVASLASLVLDYLDQSTDPAFVSWVSDRDAILDRHDGATWDIAALMAYIIKAGRQPISEIEKGPLKIAKFMHVTPEQTGKNYLDPLIRLPDYLAAAASNMNLHTYDFGSPKLEAVGTNCFIQAENSVLCTLSWTGNGFTSRRLRFKQC